MPRLILLLLIGLGIWYGWQYLKTRPPGQRKRLLWVYGSSLLLIVCAVLVASGRMHWVGAALAAMIPLARSLVYVAVRYFPLLRFIGGRVPPSTLTTAGLRVTFNFASGEAHGELFTGPHKGCQLDQLSEAQLREQLDFFKQSDRQSALLLQAYMLRKGIGGFSSAGQGGELSTSMTQNEAWQVLGLEPGASREEIIRAHKKLIQKLHPEDQRRQGSPGRRWLTPLGSPLI